MPDREKVIYDIERCICHVPDACRDCSHYGHGEVIGCMEELLTDALALLKEQEETINDLTDTIRQLNQHIKDLSEYMTPYGKVKDIKACAELLKEQEPIEPEMIIDGLAERYRCKCGAYLFKCGNYRWDYCHYCGKKMKWE